MKLLRLALVLIGVLLPAIGARGDVVWTISSLDASGSPETDFLVGESGFVEVNFALSGAESTLPAVGYQSVVSLSNGAGVSVLDAIDVVGDDYHTFGPDTTVVPMPPSPTSEFSVGEFTSMITTPPAAGNAFRLPFTVNAPGDYTFSVIPTAANGSTTAWNGSTANQVFGLGSSATISVSAVPEPGSVVFCSVIAGGVYLRRRRRVLA